jgi:hypothetical protein
MAKPELEVFFQFPQSGGEFITAEKRGISKKINQKIMFFVTNCCIYLVRICSVA